MAAATSVSRYTGVLGPIKVEFIKCTMAASLDTVDSLMANPQWAMAFRNEGTAAGGVCGTVITGKSIAVADAGISADQVLLVVVGF